MPESKSWAFRPVGVVLQVVIDLLGCCWCRRPKPVFGAHGLKHPSSAEGTVRECLWCAGRDSNPYALRLRVLSPLRLPIPSPARCRGMIGRARSARRKTASGNSNQCPPVLCVDHLCTSELGDSPSAANQGLDKIVRSCFSGSPANLLWFPLPKWPRTRMNSTPAVPQELLA
jgi:hypothetical protein